MATPEEKKREVLGLSYAPPRQRPAPTISTVQRPATAPPVQTAPVAAPTPISKFADVKRAVTAGDFSSPQAAGATVRASAEQAVDAAQYVGKALSQPVRAAYRTAVPAVAGFVEGLKTGDPGTAAQDVSKAQSLSPVQPQSIPTKLSDVKPAPVENNDSRVADWLKTNSTAAGADLNAKNVKPVDGIKDLGYAGKYGETDVFRGKGSSGEASFSDLANLATTRGGSAAALPREGEAGYGNTTVTNEDVASNGIRFNAVTDPTTGETRKMGVKDMPAAPALVAARKAAAARGDYEAYDRSFMDTAGRAAADEAKSFSQMQSAARKQNPGEAYKNEMSGMGDALKTQYDMAKDQQATERNQSNDFNSKLNQAFTAGIKSLPVLEDGSGTPDPGMVKAFQSQLAEVARKNPSLSYIEWLGMVNADDADLDAVMPVIP